MNYLVAGSGKSGIGAVRLLLKLGENVKKIADKIIELKDIETYRKLIEYTVLRIEIKNIDKSISCIQISYINGETDSLLYSYLRLYKKFQ